MKKISFIITSIIISIIAFSGCAPSGQPDGDDNDPSGKAYVNGIVIEVGKETTIPELKFQGVDTASVVYKILYPSGLSITLDSSRKVLLPNIGMYSLICTSGDAQFIKNLYVVDTEKPKFRQLWYDFTAQAYDIPGYVGQEVDLNDIFIAEDNSGECTVTYKVEKGGVTPIVLTEGSKFVVENCNNYYIYATASDSSGNISTVRYRMLTIDRGSLIDFNFNNSSLSYFAFYGSNSADQYTEQSIALLESIAFEPNIIYGVGGASLKIPVNTASQANKRFYIHFSRLNIDFAEVAGISYKVYIAANANLEAGTILTNSVAVPHLVTHPQGASAVVGEWSEIKVQNTALTGNVLGFQAFNSQSGGFPGAIDYTFYIDDIRVNYKPVISNIPQPFTVVKGSEINLMNYNIKGKDLDTGENLNVMFSVTNSGVSVPVTDGKFIINSFGAYTVTANVTSADGYAVSKSFTIN